MRERRGVHELLAGTSPEVASPAAAQGAWKQTAQCAWKQDDREEWINGSRVRDSACAAAEFEEEKKSLTIDDWGAMEGAAGTGGRRAQREKGIE